jgi:hyaluronan synthase
MHQPAANAAHRHMMMAGVFTASAIIAWAAVYRAHTGTLLHWSLLGYGLIIAVVAFSAAAPGRRFTHLPAAPGRVVAIIPAWNETPAALHSTILSLLAGTKVPDEIHVVDDGSDDPLPRFVHPAVFWHRQPNAGKRGAQARVLSMLRADRHHGRSRADYILTVDSDGEVDPHAVEHLLRAMSDERVQAATGLPLTRNRAANGLTRVIDLEITSICMTYRAARSMLGSLTTCSGALSLYRSGLVLDNLDDYVSDTNAGDDRRLTHYALLRGRVVSVAEAIVHTDMPDRLRQLYRQRVRWSTSHWYYAPWEIGHLPTESMLWTTYTLVLSVLVPLSLVWALAVAPLFGYGFPWQALAYWLGVCWLVNLRYAMSRPACSAPERWMTWLFGTPLLLFVQLAVIRPAMVHALFKTRTSDWGTRGTRHRRTLRDLALELVGHPLRLAAVSVASCAAFVTGLALPAVMASETGQPVLPVQAVPAEGSAHSSTSARPSVPRLRVVVGGPRRLDGPPAPRAAKPAATDGSGPAVRTPRRAATPSPVAPPPAETEPGTDSPEPMVTPTPTPTATPQPPAADGT